jgi:uroporphyrinogen decarboxylase
MTQNNSSPNPTPRERFIAALERRPLTGRVPHFELVFYLTMEAFGKIHPTHRYYSQWDQMEEKELPLHREDIADIYIGTAERYCHDAIFIHDNPGTLDECLRIVDTIRERSGDKYFLLRHGDATFSIPDGNAMYDFAYWMADDPDKLHVEAQRMVDDAVRRAETMARHGGLDGFALCADYCLNQGPFLSPRLFSQFVTPYLAQLTQAYRDLGFYVIKHMDGNICPSSINSCRRTRMPCTASTPKLAWTWPR